MTTTAIAVDIGGSHVECGIVRDNEILGAERISIGEASLGAILPKLEALIPELVCKCGIELANVSGLAIGICAVVGSQNSVVSANNKYMDAIGFSFAEWSRNKFGLHCIVENDTRLALLGEQFVGVAKGFSDVVMVTLGSGIGGAAMLGGKLLKSKGHRAGSLAGHLVVDWQGRLCSCGNRGCAEAEASTSSLDTICRDDIDFSRSSLACERSPITFHKLFCAADEGDLVARSVLRRCIEVWSSLSVSLIHAYDPQIIVFGGGVMARQETIVPAIRAHINRYAWLDKGSISVVASSLGSSATLFGAIPLLAGT